MNNNETYTPCTKCGRPLSYCKGQCCGKPKGCQCKEYCGSTCAAIRPGEPKCPPQAVIPSLTVESVSNLKDLADCFVHVSDINTTFYIDDKHRIMTTWAGLVSVEDYDFEANPLNLRGQIAYDAKNNKAAIYDKQGVNYIFQISDINNDYMLLENKPQINGVTLEGNKTSADLGIPDVDEVSMVFDTVADMQAATNLVDGSYARTLGYTTLNDKMGGLYKITTVSTGNIPLDDGVLYAKHIKENATVSIDDYDGATAEDRLYAALDDIASGTIIGGDITITKQYNAGAKDYRKIIITNCNFDIQYNHWFDQSGSSFNTVPCFSNCVISGNGNTMYVSDYKVTGASFNNCIFSNVCIYTSDANYIQSPYFINCQMYGVENLFTATTAYDFKMIGCRVESATGKLVVITGNPGLMQGAVTSCLIEGRTNVVFEISNIYSFSITGCYFEACNGGVLSQTASAGSAFVVIRGNSFFAPMSGTDYIVTLATSAYQRANMSENLTNLPNGKYLCNKNVQYNNILNRQNINYSNTETFKNDGFATLGSTHAYDVLASNYSSATYDSDNSEWSCKFRLRYGEAYAVVRPFLLSFVGSIGNSTLYRGYANILITPRIGYANGAVSLLCDAKILDSCNTINATPSSTVTVSVTLSSTTPTANGAEITVKIGGFTSTSGQYRVLDMFQIISVDHMSMNI